jgi:hypothetical protein
MWFCTCPINRHIHKCGCCGHQFFLNTLVLCLHPTTKLGAVSLGEEVTVPEEEQVLGPFLPTLKAFEDLVEIFVEMVVIIDASDITSFTGCLIAGEEPNALCGMSSIRNQI